MSKGLFWRTLWKTWVIKLYRLKVCLFQLFQLTANSSVPCRQTNQLTVFRGETSTFWLGGGGWNGTLPCRYVKCPAQKWMTKMPAIQGKLIYYGYLKEFDISQLDISDMVGKQQYYTTSNVLYVMEMIIFHIGGNHKDSHFSSCTCHICHKQRTCFL